MLQDFFEHLINRVYQDVRVLSVWFIKSLPTASSYIKFGGWEISYNWKGLTRPSQEVVGNIRIITKVIYFNYKYSLQLIGINTDQSYDFPHFVRTIAHEIAHCLLIDHDPQYLDTNADQHNQTHQILTEWLNIYLWTLPEIQELSYFQNTKIIPCV